MTAIFLAIHPDNPEGRKIEQVAKIIRNGGVIIYPTDTLYALGCDITNNKAVERIARLKGIKPAKATFSFVCPDLSNIAHYTKPFNNRVYKAMRKHLPGPFTFILPASNQVPKMLKNNRKQVGIRVPNSAIVSDLLNAINAPLMSSSLKNIDDEVTPYLTDPRDIYDQYKNQVDLIIDGGFGDNNPSTIVDCTSGEAEVVRQGLGLWEL